MRPSDYPRPAVTVDIVVFTILDADLKVLLIERGEPPFKGAWALPGGFVRVAADKRRERDVGGEDLEAAARRELAEETGLREGTVFLEQLYTFGDIGRDPRMRVITVAYYALVRPDLAPFVQAGTDASDARWLSVGSEVGVGLGDDISSAGTGRDVLALAFDHHHILTRALERVRGKIDYSNIAFELVQPTFTTAELRAVHEVIKGRAYDPANFRRRLRRMITDGVIEEAPGKRITGRRPAKVYRFKGAIS